MYSVVGCPDCGALKIVDGRPETTTCPRCGRRSTFRKLRAFYRSEDLAQAREVRGRIAADRSDADVDLPEIDPGDVEAAGMDDDAYLDARGVDAEAARTAGERTAGGSGGGSSRRETVLSALRTLEEPDREAVVERAAAEGVPPEWTERALEKFRERGVVTETDGTYRLL
jgi:hypothetical protein